jgi:hypothetical protein
VAVIPAVGRAAAASAGDRPGRAHRPGRRDRLRRRRGAAAAGARPEGVALLPAAMVVLGASCGRSGSFGRDPVPLPADPLLTTVAQMAGGGLALLLAGRWRARACGCRGQRRVVAGLGLPRGLRVDRRVHRLQLAARRRAGQPGVDVRVRQPGGRRAARAR